MFVNCRHCKALIATDPATDLPPERCPRCGGVLREPVAVDAPTEAAPTASTSAAIEAASAAAAPLAPDASASTTPAPAIEDAQPAVDATAGATASRGDRADDDGIGDAAIGSGTAQEPVPPTPPAPDPGTSAGTPAGEPQAAPGATAAGTPVATAGDVAAETVPPPPGTVAAASDPDAVEGTDETTPAATSTATDDESAAAPRPGFLASAAPAAAAGKRRWRLPAAIAALAVLLLLPVVLADRARLAADAQWRPLAAAACGVFGCSLPPWREPGAFVLLARDVRPHPDKPGALRVRATFRNDARWAQAWPALLLTLSDVDGRAVAARAFDAGEYLASPPAAAVVEPGQTVDIALDIREPSAATVSYAFDFR